MKVRIVSCVLTLDVDGTRVEHSLMHPLQDQPFSAGDLVEFVDTSNLSGFVAGDRFVVAEVTPGGELRAEGWKGSVFPSRVRHVEPYEILRVVR